MNKNVLFVDSLINRRWEGLRGATVSLVSALRNQGIVTDIFPFYAKDTNLHEFRKNEEKFIQQVAAKTAGYGHLFLSGWTGSWNRMKRIAKEAKQNNPNLRIVAGGPHIDFTEMYRRHLSNPLDVLFQEAPEIDVFVFGESEDTIIDLVENGCEDTRGLAYRNGKNFISNGWRTLAENLDELPFPELKPEELSGKRWAYIETARGCRYGCTFCSESLKWSDPTKRGTYRRKSPNRVIDEIKYYNAHGINHFRFTDSTLTFNPDLEEICDMVDREGLSISWSGFARVNEVLRLSLKKMKEAGCETLLIGFESGSADELKRMRKGYTKNQANEAVSKLREAGIKIRGSWIIGLPYETEVDFQETLAFAKLLNLDANAVHAYEDQQAKFQAYTFGALDFELDIPNKAFQELIASTALPKAATEMHFLPRLCSMKSQSVLSEREQAIYYRIKRFYDFVGNKDKDYDTRDRYDRRMWEEDS